MKNAEKPKIETFLAINDSILYTNPTETNTISNKPENIQYQIPVSANQLTDKQIQSIDTDVLRNVRVLTNFSKIDELDFYQMYNILKQMKNAIYNITYDPSTINKKSQIISSEKLIALNSGAINNTDLELFTIIKLELISALNNLIIKTGYYTPYHPYQFFKIINSNLISNIISQTGSNYIFTLTVAREYKFQQFVIYYDLDLIQNNTINNTTSNTYSFNLNKIELIGIPIPKTIEFHDNRKTTDKEDVNGDTNINSGSTDIYKDQVSNSSSFDVMPIGDKSAIFQSPELKFIDLTERSDMDPTLFDQGSLSAKVEDRIMNVARDKQYNNHRC